MQIVYTHGIARHPAPRILKLIWDEALFGHLVNNSAMAYWADINYPDLTPIINIDDYLSQVTEKITNVWLKDVHGYFYEPEKRKKIQSRFEDQLIDECVIVSHSLGTVVAYEVLSRRPDIKVPMWITLGSPLGLENIKVELRKNGYGASKPESVLKWYNFSDPRDIVAADKSVADEYLGTHIKDHLILNKGLDPHSAAGYLKDNAVQRAVRLGLSYPFSKIIYNRLS